MTDQHQGRCVICADRPAWADRLVCTACYGGLRDDLTVCAGAYAWLGECMLALPPSWRTSTIRSNEIEAAAPMPLGLVDARTRISETLLFWVRAAMEIRPGRGGPPTPSVAGCTWWLRRQLHWIVRNPAVETLARDLADLRRDARRSAPWDRVRRDLPTRCPHCWRLSLTWYQGDDWVTCRIDDCGRLLPWGRYHRAVADWTRLQLARLAKETHVNTDTSTNLVAFVSARLDEDEADARGFRGVFPSPVVFENGDVALHAHREGSAVIVAYSNPREGDGDMQALSQWGRPAGLGWGSARVLAEVAAKRALIDEHARIWMANQWVQEPDGHRRQHSVPVCRRCAHNGQDILFGNPVYPCNTLKLLAAPYADHPDFKAEWRIEETSGDR